MNAVPKKFTPKQVERFKSNMPAEVRQLIPHATLPQVYEQTCTMLARCVEEFDFGQINTIAAAQAAMAQAAAKLGDKRVLEHANRLKCWAEYQLGTAFNVLSEKTKGDILKYRSALGRAAQGYDVIIPPKPPSTTEEGAKLGIGRHGVSRYQAAAHLTPEQHESIVSKNPFKPASLSQRSRISGSLNGGQPLEVSRAIGTIYSLIHSAQKLIAARNAGEWAPKVRAKIRELSIAMEELDDAMAEIEEKELRK
jgi:hypothetical protein